MRVMGSFWGSRISISQLSLWCHFESYLDEVFVCYPAVFIFGNTRGLLELHFRVLWRLLPGGGSSLVECDLIEMQYYLPNSYRTEVVVRISCSLASVTVFVGDTLASYLHLHASGRLEGLLVLVDVLSLLLTCCKSSMCPFTGRSV